MKALQELKNNILNDRKHGINYAGYDTVLDWIDQLIEDDIDLQSQLKEERELSKKLQQEINDMHAYIQTIS